MKCFRGRLLRLDKRGPDHVSRMQDAPGVADRGHVLRRSFRIGRAGPGHGPYVHYPMKRAKTYVSAVFPDIFHQHPDPLSGKRGGQVDVPGLQERFCLLRGKALQGALPALTFAQGGQFPPQSLFRRVLVIQVYGGSDYKPSGIDLVFAIKVDQFAADLLQVPGALPPGGIALGGEGQRLIQGQAVLFRRYPAQD